MSKRKKVFLSISAVFFALFIIVCVQNGVELFQSSYFYYRAYKGDRITINLTATIGGKLMESDNIKAYATYERNSENTVLVQDNDDCVTLLVKAGDYGEYLVNTEIDEYHFVFRAMQWNWWDVQNINLYIDIDTKKNEYKTYEEYSHITEECNIINESEPEETYEISDINYISVGCKG